MENKKTNRNLVLGWIKNESTAEDINLLINTIKTRRIIIGQQVKSNLMIGDKVTINARYNIETGTIMKVMKTRCAVKYNSNGLIYACPMNMIVKHKPNGEAKC